MMSSSTVHSNAAESTSASDGVRNLLVAIVVIATLWCIVLPHVATLPAVSEYTEFLDERGIDPSAMFYTELDAMDPILEKLESPTASTDSMMK